ncbi:NADH dehydrogenase [ubiquinone] 1 beta subcomplex subunit 8, mitochondrial-like [Varroa jacobsoni]|uniref:NADH dehydrogenase [ubiquinone] 1 beta subcomplex subunit 8, mitochondrial n=1 Tax=Varroa destructor TaxID=109461 RepID=A0A7M7L3Y7_VARDE|nr:NADH dehydrogenase [ubiquinone] 1 beta subcomplex subunit 8, mitochondrial-like [Varroa destructor]XP_022702613.1 NADH dehydrogenase [ubiquinone] 1 beta subcomplex subunit 8, mitochondrial-like [Varroa jacobsoni]
MAFAGARNFLVKALPAKGAVANFHTGQFCAAVLTNRDWKPGPYPKTEAERRAAAKKYNMIYEDYKPYPENHDDTMGDYPMLPALGLESKNPYAAYDFPAYRRNYGEPIMHDFDMYTRERWNVTERHHVTLIRQLFAFLGVVGAVAGYHALSEYYSFYCELSPVPITKQYPREGVVHYTFEPAD